MNSQNTPRKVGRPRKVENITVVDPVETGADTVLIRSNSKKRGLVLTDDEANVGSPERKRKKMSNKEKLFAIESPKPSACQQSPKHHTCKSIGKQPESVELPFLPRARVGRPRTGRPRVGYFGIKPIREQPKSGIDSFIPKASPQISVSHQDESPKPSTSQQSPKRHMRESIGKHPESVESPSLPIARVRHVRRKPIWEQPKSGIDSFTSIASPQISFSHQDELPKPSTSQQSPKRHMHKSIGKRPESVESPSLPRARVRHVRRKPIGEEPKSGIDSSTANASPHISVSHQEDLLQAEESKPLDQDTLIDKTNSDELQQGEVQLCSTLSESPKEESNLKNNGTISDNCESLISDNPKLRQFNWFYPAIWENLEPKPRYLLKCKDLVIKQKARELKAHVEINKIFCESDLSDLQKVLPDCVSKPCLDTPEDNTQMGVPTAEPPTTEPPTIELPGLSSEGIRLSKFLDCHKVNEENSSGLGYSNLESSLHVKKEICNKFFNLCSDAGLYKAQFAGGSNKLNVTSKTVPLLVCKTSKNSDEQNNFLPNLDSVTLVKPSREELLLKHFSKQRLFDPTNTKQLHDRIKVAEEENLQECARVFPAKYKPTTRVLSSPTFQETEILLNHTVGGSSQAHQLTVERRCSLKSKNFYSESERRSYLRLELMSSEILDKPTPTQSWFINHIADAYLNDAKSGIGVEKFDNFSCMYPEYLKYKEPVGVEVYEDSGEDVEDYLSLSQEKNEMISSEANDSKVSYRQGKEVKILSRKLEYRKNKILSKRKDTCAWKDVSGPSKAKKESKLRKAKASPSAKSLARSQLPQAVNRSTLCKQKQVTSSSRKFKEKKDVILSKCKNISTLTRLSRPINSSQTSLSNSLSVPTNLISSPQPMTFEALLVPTTEALAQPEQVETRKICKRKRDNSFSDQSNEKEAQPVQVDTFKAKKCKKIIAVSSQSKNQSQTEIISKTQPVFVEALNNVSNEGVQESEQTIQNETLITKKDENDRNYIIEIKKCLMEKIAIAGLLKSNLQEIETVLTKEQEEEIIQNILLAFQNEQIKTKMVEVIDNDDDCIILENLPGPSNIQLASTDATLPVPKDVQILFKSKHDEMSPGSSVLPDLPKPVPTKMLQDHAHAQEIFQSEKDDEVPNSIISSIQLTPDKISNVSETLPKTTTIQTHCEPNQVDTFPGTRPNIVGILCKFLCSEDAPEPRTLRNLLNDANTQLSSDISNGNVCLLHVSMEQIKENEITLTKEQDDNFKQGILLAVKNWQERRKVGKNEDCKNFKDLPASLNAQPIYRGDMLSLSTNVRVLNKPEHNQFPSSSSDIPAFFHSTKGVLHESPNVPHLPASELTEMLQNSANPGQTAQQVPEPQVNIFPNLLMQTEVLHESPNVPHLPASEQTEMLQDSANSGQTAQQVPEPQASISPNLLMQTEVLNESPNVPHLPASEQTEMLQNSANPGQTAQQVPEPQTNISPNLLTQAESLDVLTTMPEAISVKDKVAEPILVDTFPNAQPALVETLRKFLNGEDASEPGMYRSLFIDNICQPSSGLSINNAGPSNINKQQTKENETLLTKEQEDKIKQALFLALKKEQGRRKAMEIINNFIKAITNMKFPPKK